MNTEQTQKTGEIKRIVIWGLRYKYHTHRHIHQSFYKNAKKLGYDALWVEDEKENAKLIQPGDLIISADPVGKMVKEKMTLEDYNIPVKDGVYYRLHNLKPVFVEKIQPAYLIKLYVYEDHCIKPEYEKWGPVTFFDPKGRSLYQPWGTDLLASEFKKPVFRKNSFVFWIGSIWNDHLNRGNLKEIAELKRVLTANKLRFVQIRFIPDALNTFFIRLSRIAPAIAGHFQTTVNYLPCRMFKNISYGQLGITNIKKFKDILGEYFIEGETIEEIIENALKLSKEEYIELVKAQQAIIKNYTYQNAIENILRTFK